MPKSLAPAGAFRGPLLGSTNPLTSVIPGITGYTSPALESSAAAIGLATVGIGMYDATIEFGGIHLRCPGRIFVSELQRLQPIAVISGAALFLEAIAIAAAACFVGRHMSRHRLLRGRHPLSVQRSLPVCRRMLVGARPQKCCR